jgi:hypothetical protein
LLLPAAETTVEALRSCRDLDALDRWVRRAGLVASTDELLAKASTAPATRDGAQRRRSARRRRSAKLRR